ncbi:hypothetical protein M0Q28_02230 [Patescibacteria group bacterium]|jgi:type II secretory pathway pseudopilin PulG|nr:hypothetical protein [Patescibacteria group bacterium]
MKQKGKKLESPKYNTFAFRAFSGTVIVAVVAVVVAGLWLAGSPAEERARRLDSARISDMQNISNAIDQYYNANKMLPSDLDTLSKARETYYVNSVVDPETMLPYEYTIRDTDTYDLCATFATDNSQDQQQRPPEPYPTWESRFWEHKAERTCFNITARTYPK